MLQDRPHRKLGTYLFTSWDIWSKSELLCWNLSTSLPWQALADLWHYPCLAVDSFIHQCCHSELMPRKKTSSHFHSQVHLEIDHWKTISLFNSETQNHTYATVLQLHWRIHRRLGKIKVIFCKYFTMYNATNVTPLTTTRLKGAVAKRTSEMKLHGEQFVFPADQFWSSCFL